jgi:hypothetical protein
MEQGVSHWVLALESFGVFIGVFILFCPAEFEAHGSGY